MRGGGAKGFYTLGLLKGIEGTLGAPLLKQFDLVTGRALAPQYHRRRSTACPAQDDADNGADEQ